MRHAHIRALVRMRSLNSILGSVRVSKLLPCRKIGRFGMATHLPSHCVLIVCDELNSGEVPRSSFPKLGQTCGTD